MEPMLGSWEPLNWAKQCMLYIYTLKPPYQGAVVWRVPVTGNVLGLRNSTCNPKESNQFSRFIHKSKADVLTGCGGFKISISNIILPIYSVIG